MSTHTHPRGDRLARGTHATRNAYYFARDEGCKLLWRKGAMFIFADNVINLLEIRET